MRGAGFVQQRSSPGSKKKSGLKGHKKAITLLPSKFFNLKSAEVGHVKLDQIVEAMDKDAEDKVEKSNFDHFKIPNYQKITYSLKLSPKKKTPL
jgi:hypothetical protein